MTKQKWDRATIIGCGLIGASFALALKRACACGVLAGWDTSAAALDEALKRGIVDEADQAFNEASLSTIVSTSDLIYLAMPVAEIIRFLRERGGRIKRGAVVTDAGSTKAEICRAARAFLPEGRTFVGGHPIAGSHLRGPAHARADLFNDAAYALIPSEDKDESKAQDVSAAQDDSAAQVDSKAQSESNAVVALKETVELFGARVVLLTADEHDRALAFVSHLPQVASSALAAVVKEQADAPALAQLSGAGYRDMTRLAASSWLVWRDILATNSSNIAEALDLLIARLTAARDELRQPSERDETSALGILFNDSRRQ
ncbi:MAG: prephenate dehydrogenase [Blastocatellia bacterium]|jgi:prephenate dehydrogenase|nr:prephenate dehydrogenase [Blastocatellia bacterium]